MKRIDDIDIENLVFNDGLIPAIAQDYTTGAVLMLAYMTRESLLETLRTGFATYYSRKRKALWKKGETSGNTQRVIEIACDCDSDTLLLKVEQKGPACHTGSYSCFSQNSDAGFGAVHELYNTIAERAENPVEGSYTNYLLSEGIEKICKKIGEEASEVIIAAMKNEKLEIQYEAADLVYHMLVLLYDRGLLPKDISAELLKRRK